MPKILEIKDLYVKVSDENGGKAFYAVKGLNFSMDKGEVLGIVGESGSGKTMTALAIMGLLKKNVIIEKGEIVYGGVPLTSLSKKERQNIYGNKIAMIFQEPMSSLNPLMRIGKQVEENAAVHLKLSKKALKEVAVSAMEQAGIKQAALIYNAYPHQLSGGMRQRIMIASAIICNPDILIADEPTTALDVTIQAQIIELLKELVSKSNMSMLFISHNIGIVRRICDNTAVLYKGDLVDYGKTACILDAPKHSYTRALINSIPTPEKKGSPLSYFNGEI